MTFGDILRDMTAEELFACAINAYYSFGTQRGCGEEQKVMAMCRYLKDAADKNEKDEDCFFVSLSANVSPYGGVYFPTYSAVFFEHRLAGLGKEEMKILRAAARLTELSVEENSEMLVHYHETVNDALPVKVPMWFVFYDTEMFLGTRITNSTLKCGAVNTVAYLIARYLADGAPEYSYQRDTYESIALARAVVEYKDRPRKKKIYKI